MLNLFLTLNMNKQPRITRHLRDMTNTKEKDDSKGENRDDLEETEIKSRIKLF